MNLRERFSAVQNRIDALSLRERGVLFLVLSLLLYFLVDAALIAPQERQQKQLLSELSALRAEISQLEQQKLAIIESHTTDPNAEERRRLLQLQEESQGVEAAITAALFGLVEPREMARALERVLKEQRQLRFVRVRNLGASPLLDIDPGEAVGDDAGIFKHTMRIELEGSFQQTQRYLQALEHLPWRFHWDSVELQMVDYPRARVVITVSTLSLSEGWIGV